MPEYKVEILTPAAKDIEKIAGYHLRMTGSGMHGRAVSLRTTSPESAEKITNKLLDTIQILEEQPYSGMEHPDDILRKQNYRKLISGEYICVYKVIGKRGYIYRVVHGATDYPKLFISAQ